MDWGEGECGQAGVWRVGRFTEGVGVGQMAPDCGKVGVPPWWKTGIGAAATAHLAAVSPNCRFIEFLPAAVAESRLRRELVSDELQIVKGRLQLPRHPGLGVSLNPEAFSRFAAAAEWLCSPRPLPNEA